MAKSKIGRMETTELFKQYQEKTWLWACNPMQWVKDVFPHFGKVLTTETGMSTQQEQATRELGKLIRAKLKAYRGDEMTPEEVEYSKKIGISIMSGQGTGKDFWTALMGCFFLTCFPFPKLAATANTAKQLRNVLWSEISKVMSLAHKVDPNDPTSPTILQQILTWQAEKVFLTAQRGERWFWEGVTCNVRGSEDEQAEVLGGRHEDFMMLIADEASGIPDGVFKPLEGTLTGICNLLVVIFNPTRPRGFAIESQTDPRFINLRWNSEESELVTKEHCEGMAARYGKDSNTYRIRVSGLPPHTEKDTLIPWEWMEDAVERWEYLEFEESDPMLLGVDVGGGGDQSVICRRRGGVVQEFDVKNDPDTMAIAGWVVQTMDKIEADATMIDLIGLGRGVFDRVKQLRHRRVYGIDARKKAKMESKFFNVRAEMYWRLREAFEEGTIAIPPNKDLMNQLGATKFKTEGIGSTSKTQIIRKEEVRRELGGESPDEADALALTYAHRESLFRREKPDPYDEHKVSKEKKTGWMAA